MLKSLMAEILGINNQLTIEETQNLDAPRFYVRSYGPPSIGGIKLDTVWSIYNDGSAVGSFPSAQSANQALEFLNNLNVDFTFHDILVALERFKNDDHYNPLTIYRRS